MYGVGLGVASGSASAPWAKQANKITMAVTFMLCLFGRVVIDFRRSGAIRWSPVVPTIRPTELAASHMPELLRAEDPGEVRKGDEALASSCRDAL